MSTATIIIILFIITLAAIGLIFYIQARERARIERARRLAAAEDAFQHSYRLLDELPPEYLNQELRQIILNRLEDLAVPLKTLNSRMEVDGKIAEARSRLIQSNQEPTAPVRIDTPDTSRYIRTLLESLFRLVESQHKARKLETGQARRLLKQILFLGFRTQADLHINIGREEAGRGNLRKAIHHYHLAATELGKSKDHPLAQKVIKACRTRIQELENEANGGDRKGEPKTPDKSRLDEQIDEFIQEEEAWKKRADFES
jgi:type II secretory pathway pseudopilin PulG